MLAGKKDMEGATFHIAKVLLKCVPAKGMDVFQKRSNHFRCVVKGRLCQYLKRSFPAPEMSDISQVFEVDDILTLSEDEQI